MKTILKILGCIVLLATSAMGQASSIETWECKDRFGSEDSVLVTATVEVGRKSGSISVAGITYPAMFQVDGFDRRWDFGSANSGYGYAFVIEPNGDAAYYDFKGKKTTKASNLMRCRQVDNKPE